MDLNNRIKDAFDAMHAEESLKQSTMEFLSQKSAPRARKGFSGRIRLAATAAACVFALLLIVGSITFFTPVSAISMDMNPSIELNINGFDRVISVKGYNEDGRLLADRLDVRYMFYGDAVQAILSSDAISEYVDRDALVTVTVSAANSEKSDAMLARVSSCAAAQSENVCCRAGNREDVETAHDMGLSFGKYAAFLELQALDPNVTVEDVQGLTMRQIQNRIDTLCGETHANQSGNGHGGESGNGSGNGGASGSGQGQDATDTSHGETHANQSGNGHDGANANGSGNGGASGSGQRQGTSANE